MGKKRRVALVELGGSHAECLYSQLSFLETLEYDVYVLCSENLSHIVTYVPNNRIQFFPIGKGTTSDWKSLIEIKRFLLENRFAKVILNTSGGNLIRNLLTFHFPFEMEFTGVLHDTIKLEKSFTQKLISRKVKKYLVLNDYIKDSFPLNKSFRLESFYPIFFPKYVYPAIEKDENEFWVCVPGSIEYRRRDYEGFIEIMKSQIPDQKVKILLLGNSKHLNSDSEDLKTKLKEYGIEKFFVFFEGFIGDDMYHAYVEKSDVIMPLIHHTHPIFDEVNGFKISGSFNLAFGHKKPLLCEEQFERFEDFRENAFFYDFDNLFGSINSLAGDKSVKEEKTKGMYKNPKWSFEFQRDKYIAFLES